MAHLHQDVWPSNQEQSLLLETVACVCCIGRFSSQTLTTVAMVSFTFHPIWVSIGNPAKRARSIKRLAERLDHVYLDLYICNIRVNGHCHRFRPCRFPA